MDARIARLRDFFAQDPTNAELACELVDALLEQSAVDDARQLLESLPMPAATAPGVCFRLGRCALASGDYAAAETAYATLAATGIDAAPLAHDLAFAQLCQRKAGVALATAQAAISRFGADAALLLVQARAQSMLGAYRDAVATLDALLAAQPAHAGAAGVRALALLDADEHEAAATSRLRPIAATGGPCDEEWSENRDCHHRFHIVFFRVRQCGYKRGQIDVPAIRIRERRPWRSPGRQGQIRRFRDSVGDGQ
jgi:lipopolysaccharide biosynthesis regulator YciM